MVNKFKNQLIDKLEKIFLVIRYYPKYARKNTLLTKRFFKLLFLRGPYSAFQDAYDFLQLPSWQNSKKGKIGNEATLDVKLTKDYQILNFPAIIDPEISVIIPVKNKFKYTFNCLKSILDSESGLAYEIIIADDGSTDETKEIRKYCNNIELIRNETSLGFLKNCNQAARQAHGKYLLFLNNDTIVQKNALSYLLNLLEGDESIGIVGPKLVYADGELQEAGGIILPDGTALNRGKHQNPNLPEFNKSEEVDYVSGACLLIKNSLWKEIGGFDEMYCQAYYEDSDLAFEVRKRGYKIMYQPLSVVVHFENSSYDRVTDSHIGDMIEKNKEKFAKKWSSVLQKERS